MKKNDFTIKLDSVKNGSIESLEIIESDELWRMGEKFVFDVARYLDENKRALDILALIGAAEIRGEAFGGKRSLYIKYIYGDALLELREYDKAIIVYGDIVNIDGHHAAYNNLALALWMVGNFQGALDGYLKAVCIDGNDPISLRGVGEMLNRMNRSKEAIPYLERAVKIDPLYSGAFRALGVAYFNSDEWEGAYRSLKKAVSLDPSDQVALKGLARLGK